jgi:fatty acid desaturase
MFSDVPDEELTKMWSRFMVLNQTWFYFPILSFARLSWCLQSILFVLPNGQAHKPSGARVPISLVEQLSLAMHWTWYFATMFLFIKDPVNMIVYFLVSQAVCGNLLAIVFSLNHNGMPVISREEAVDMDFFTKQIITGRDVHPSLFANWFTGGLNYQIEHHLFPSMPRHNFSKIQPAVESLCKKYGVRYHTTGIIGGTVEVFARLNEVSKAASKMGKSS